MKRQQEPIVGNGSGKGESAGVATPARAPRLDVRDESSFASGDPRTTRPRDTHSGRGRFGAKIDQHPLIGGGAWRIDPNASSHCCRVFTFTSLFALLLYCERGDAFDWCAARSTNGVTARGSRDSDC